MGERVLAWHAVPDDDGHPVLRHPHRGERARVVVGQVLEVEPPLRMCEHGLHASISPLDAVGYGRGPWLCRVELGGEIERSQDKVVAQRRTVLSIVHAERTLRRCAADWAERALRLAGVTDAQSWEAVYVARRYARGGATEDELRAAWDAAGGAAWAADDAAGAAAGAAAWAAAWAAARAAADAAGADDAARAAAGAAADAARADDAARAAARAAAKEAAAWAADAADDAARAAARAAAKEAAAWAADDAARAAARAAAGGAAWAGMGADLESRLLAEMEVRRG